MKIIARNRSARYHYVILHEYEAGIELKGIEVKALRVAGTASINSAYAIARDGEIFVQNMNIPVSGGSHKNHAPERERKLLLHRNQINKIIGISKIKGATVIPLSIYFNNRGLVKLEIALVKGKKIHDKRQDIKKRDIERSYRRDME